MEDDHYIWLSSRNVFRGGGEGKIYCYVNFFCYANFSTVFGSNFRGQKSPRGGGQTASGGRPLWKKGKHVYLVCKFTKI